jgi:hypothetical protein
MIKILINRRKVIAFIALWLLVLTNSHAQQLFYSQLLQNLYDTLPKACKIETTAIDTIVLCQEVIQGDTLPIVYCWDENKVLTHIGYRFMSGMDTLAINQAVVRFIERELLTLLTASDIGKTFTSYREKRLTILLNDAPVKRNFYQDKRGLLRFLSNVSSISFNSDGKKQDVSLFHENGKKLSFIFEADSELIYGMDKHERDVYLTTQLKNHHVKHDCISSPDYSYLQLLHDTVYVDKGNSFMIPQINNNLYYVKADSTYNLAFNKSLIAESFANALLVPVGNNYTINITHKMYGGIVKKYSVDSRDFDDYFIRDFDRYFGIESLEKESLTGTLILNDQNTRCIHLAYVSITLEDLLNGGIMDIKLYSNIPQHNIEKLLMLFAQVNK